MRLSTKMRLGLLGLFILLFLAQVFPAGTELHPDRVLEGPSSLFWLGTDEFGRDLLSRLLQATGLSLTVALLVVGLSYGLGLVLGSLSGYFGGYLSTVVNFLCDLFLALPAVLLAICLSGILGGGLQNSLLALVVAYSPYYVKLAQTQTQQVKASPFVQALNMTGSPLWYKILSLWRVIETPLRVYASLNVGSVILSLSTLSFLGIGVTIPQAELGELLNVGRNYFEQAPWLVLFPGLVLLLIVVFCNDLGASLGKVLDAE